MMLLVPDLALSFVGIFFEACTYLGFMVHIMPFDTYMHTYKHAHIACMHV